MPLLAAAALAVAGAACDKSPAKVDSKPAAGEAKAEGLKIAIVEVDSIMTKYDFCKDFTKAMEAKGKNIEATLSAKQKALETAAANFQQKMQQNAYTREQAEGVNANLQKQNADLQALNQRLTAEFQKETEKYNGALRDSISRFLAVYNKDKKYSLILSKAGDNILYVDKAHDITDEVVAGLNKAYKPAKAKK